MIFEDVALEIDDTDVLVEVEDLRTLVILEDASGVVSRDSEGRFVLSL